MTATVSATNPFDDSFEESKVRTNPFDDDRAGGGGRRAGGPIHSSAAGASSSGNPFDHNNDQSQDEDSDQYTGDEVEDENDDGTSGGALGRDSALSPAEASWQYLGDLPYRRVPIYTNVLWHAPDAPSSGKVGPSSSSSPAPTRSFRHYGLASFPPEAVKHQYQLLNPREARQLLASTTTTKVAGCPHGGPIAVMTLPVAGGGGSSSLSSSSSSSSPWTHTELKLLTNSGRLLSRITFPPPFLEKRGYTPADVLQLGFTSRTLLVLILKDSLCFIYNVRGELVLHPFFLLLPDNSTNGTTEVVQATVYEGGAAILTKNKVCALVELLDEHDSLDYLQTAHKSARHITSSTHEAFLDASGGATASVSPTSDSALITLLPTAAYASRHMCSFHALAVLPRSRTTSKHPELFVSTSDHSVVVVDCATLGVTDVNCRARLASPIVNMCLAPNGRFLACFTESQMLTVISTSFETKVLDFDTSEGSSSPPLDMQWCGEDSVVLHWKKLGVLMVGPYGDWLRFPYDHMEQVHLIPEMDCCRVITDTSVELLQRVPPATALLLRIGSIESSAMLLDAADAFHSGSPASDDAARAVVQTGQLPDAIETCTEAAGREFDILTQKRLLRAASYGMHFSYKNASDDKRLVMGGPVTGSDPDSGVLPSPTSVKFVAVARKLRVLNALRNPHVGFVLTSAQYDAITPSGVVARLIANFKRPALATAISKYLGLSHSVQLFARASKAAALVESDTVRSDSEVAEEAIRIINDGESGSGLDGKTAAAIGASRHRGAYSTVALAASKAGRKGVATLLLMLESSVADKVPALIATGSFSDAIAVATAARDADFIFSTLMAYEKVCISSVSASDVSKAQATYLSAVVTKFTPEAFNMLRRYLGTTSDVKSVTNLLLRAQKFADAGSAMALRAIGERDIREKQGILAEASRVFGLGKETALYKACTDEHLELLKDQEVIRTKYGSSDVAPEDSSVTGTISALLKFAASNVREQHRLFSDADKIAKKFRVSEKRLWHIKVKAFAESAQWSNLRILADSKKSPIGYKPLARAAIQGKQSSEEVMRYIDRISIPEEKYDLFCEAGFWKNALDEAGKLRDARRILNVKTMCNSSELQLQADQMMARIA